MILPMLGGAIDPQHRPVSIRLREAVHSHNESNQYTESLIDEVQVIEQLALARSITASTNGRAPWHWSIERWLHVLTFAGIIIGFIWVAGGEWSSVQDGQEALQKSVSDSLGLMSDRIDSLADTVNRFHNSGGGERP